MNPRALPLIFALLLAAGTTHAVEWLPGPGRAISRAESASPDAPVASYAYGPRARATLGADYGLILFEGPQNEFRIGTLGLVDIEDAEGAAMLPSQTLRTVFELGAALAFPEVRPFSLRPVRTLELGAAFGFTLARTLGSYTLPDRHHADDVPFGAGGGYIALDGAFSATFGPKFRFSSRIGLDTFVNAFPDLLGQTEASDVVADAAHEGAELRTRFELGLRWLAADWAEPVLLLYADNVIPHDDSAKKLWLGRALLGVALPGTAYELTPFVELEAGHGQGMLVNRTELRFGGGVRLHAR